MDYIPPLVRKRHVRQYAIDLSQVAMSPVFGGPYRTSVNPRQILAMFDLHLEAGYVAARFTAGVGVSQEDLDGLGYVGCEVPVMIPPLNAETVEDYTRVLADPVTIFGRFTADPSLGRRDARELLLVKYLKEGYTDPDKLAELGLQASRLPAYRQTSRAIERAVGDKGYVAFSIPATHPS